MDAVGLQSPQAQPIDSLTGLLRWAPGTLGADDYYACASVPLRQGEQSTLPARPRLLVCHDLAGGYGQDRFVQGTGDACQFRLHHWHSIDIFVYFSHSLVAIPPPGWINCAHRHSVPVLGTLITEWAAGAIKCLELFALQSFAQSFADQLCKVMEHYGFDGWLINIENPVPPPLLSNLTFFLRHLTDACHAANPCSLVIWYDAVTTQGLLQWQDTLNELNADFFQASDAIFVNYTWKAGTPAQAAAAACSRRLDVYMGIDVFGRNTFGGGGFNCDVAAAAAKLGGVSAALFAPAWVWEDCQDRPAQWLLRDQQLWSSLADAWVPPRVICSALPFYSDFDCGAGQKLYRQGCVISDQPWFNLSCQALQPLFQRTAFVRVLFTVDSSNASGDQSQHPVSIALEVLEGSVDDQAAWSGGCCMRFAGQLQSSTAVDMSLFRTALRIPQGGIRVSYTVLAHGPDDRSELALLLPVEPPAGTAAEASAQQLRLAGDGKSLQDEGDGRWHLQASTISRAPHSGSQDRQWETRVFDVAYPALKGYTVTAIGAECTQKGQGAFSSCLGEVCITAEGYSPPSMHANNLSCLAPQWQDETQTSDSSQSRQSSLFSATLHWQGLKQARFEVWVRGLNSRKEEASAQDGDGLLGAGASANLGADVTPSHVHHQVGEQQPMHDAQPSFVGCAFVNAYRVVELALPHCCSGLKLYVRGVCSTGQVESFNDAASVTMAR